MKEQVKPLNVEKHYPPEVRYDEISMIFIVINPLHRLKISHECLIIKIADYLTVSLSYMSKIGCPNFFFSSAF